MQNSQMPSVSNTNQKSNNDIFADGIYTFLNSNLDSSKFAPRACEKSTTNDAKGPVLTMPISVKPKTREPESFTDNRIYVSNIPFSFREQDLAAMFYKYGRVLSVEIVTNDRGSKGFGFVTLDSQLACERARYALHETHVQGRIIEVRRATPTRRKISNNQGEVLPPPKLCVDLRAPHSLWRAEPPTSNENFNSEIGVSRAFGENNKMGAPIRQPFGLIHPNVVNRRLPPSQLKCMKHSDLKLSANGDYFLKNGELTTDTSLLMCINGSNTTCRTFNENIDNSTNDITDSELTSVFPNHIRDQITALLDTSNPLPPNSARRSGSVGSSELRTSESETASDDEVHPWTPNSSPDLLASLYEGSTSYHNTN